MIVRVKAEPVLFSIVVPVYNREKLLSKTIRSILAQTYGNFEIIVVDDASTDNSFEIAQFFAREDSRIKVIRNTENKERSYSRNRGMSLAKGDFLTFLDSDDLMKPSCLQDAYEFIRKHPDYKFFHNRYELRDVKGDLLYVYPAPSLRNQYKAIMKGNFLSCIGVFLHRDVYAKFRFDENPEIIKSEDYDLWIRIIAHYRLGRINKVNSVMIQHDTRSMLNEEAENLLKRAEYIYSKILSDSRLRSVYGKYMDIFWSHRYLYASYLSLQAGNIRQSIRYIVKAMISGKGGILFEYKFFSLMQQIVNRVVFQRWL